MSAAGTPSETPGHKVLSEEQIRLVTEIRVAGHRLQELTDELRAISLRSPLPNNVDPRWLAIGRTHLQEGLMALVRSVTQPDFF
jgi:hypothetical protein